MSLSNALKSLSVLTTEDLFTYEIVVINNNSSDSTSRVIEALAQASSVPIRECVELKAGIVYARNRGVQEAAGEWIGFFDDDQIADPRWLLELLKCSFALNSNCVGGAVQLKLPETFRDPISPFCRMLLGETVGMDSLQLYTSRRTPGAGNLLIHRSVFSRIGFFREEFNKRGEDTDLFLRMHSAGIQGWYTPKALVHHVIPPERLSPDYLLRLSQIMSEGMALVERNAVGAFWFPLFWASRLAQFALVMSPRLLWSWLSRNRAQVMGIKCQMRLFKCYLEEGFPLLIRTS